MKRKIIKIALILYLLYFGYVIIFGDLNTHSLSVKVFYILSMFVILLILVSIFRNKK